MTVIIITLALIAIYFAVCSVIADKALAMVTSPVCYDEAYMREYETGHGFTEGINAYDSEWNRSPFTIDRGDAVISGEVIRNPAGTDRVAIICHGHTVNRFADLKYANMFYKLGWHIVVFDERHFGVSTGDISTLGYKESADLAAIIRYTRSVFGEKCGLALHGESMGASAVLMVLDRETPDIVFADCPFMDTEALVKTVLHGMHVPVNTVTWLAKLKAKRRYGYDIKAASPIASVRNSDVPICLFHGDADTLIPCEHSRKLFEACRSEKSELHIFSGANHAWSVIRERERYEEIIGKFIEKCL